MSYDANIGVLPQCFSMGLRVGPGFLTKVITTPNGSEYRDQLRSYDRRRWTISYSASKGGTFDALMAIVLAAGGRAKSFRARDPHDYTVTSAQGRFVATALSTKWQMVKRYTTAGGATYDRKITKPGGSSTSTSGSIDAATGIVTYASMPTSWQSPLYYVQVRFDSDDILPVTVTRNGAEGPLIVAWEDIDLVEVDEP